MIYNSNETINNTINSIINSAWEDQEKAFTACEEGWNWDEFKKMKRINDREYLLGSFTNPKEYIRKLIDLCPRDINRFIELNKDNNTALLFLDKVMTQYRYAALVNLFKFDKK